MGPELQIVAENPDHFTVTNPIHFFWWVIPAVLFFDLALTTTLTFIQPKLRKVLWPAFGAILVLLILFFGWEHTLAIDVQHGEAKLTANFFSANAYARTLPIAAIDCAKLETSRMGRRILLVMKNGEQILPLGTSYLYHASQVRIVDLINERLTRLNSPPAHDESGVERMIREERERDLRIRATLKEEESKLHE